MIKMPVSAISFPEAAILLVSDGDRRMTKGTLGDEVVPLAVVSAYSSYIPKLPRNSSRENNLLKNMQENSENHKLS